VFTAPSLKTSADAVFEVAVSNGKRMVTDTVTVSIAAAAEQPDLTSDRVAGPAPVMPNAEMAGGAESTQATGPRVDLDDIRQRQVLAGAALDRSADTPPAVAPLPGAVDPPSAAAGVTISIDTTRAPVTGGSAGQIDAPAFAFGELPADADPADGETATAESAAAASRARELPDDAANAEAQSRLSALASGGLGWLWGMFRAYGGVRDEAQSATERDNQSRT
jgi:hypothetical protein